MLYIVNSLPISRSFINSTHSGDSVIFTDNAVFAAKKVNIETESLTQKTLSHINLYVRKADLLIRDISNKDLFHNVIIIDDMQYENAISQDIAIKSCN